ncbi:DUF2993 domain-containing protein [Micromonospora sp. b486]|nr:DUF2993 domain-containing protein [Micromonospora sp. b486]MDM4777941.1 DUF2993 domain-containing protein [Micromonospora sp. b486]
MLIGFLVLLLVLAGLLVVADRVAAGVAERAIADQVRQEIAKQDAQSAAPQVEVGGFPFLTQVLDGRYERISIQLTDVRGDVQGDAVEVPKLDVDARNVTASLDTLRSGRGEVVAESVDGRGTVTYESLAKLLDRPGLTLGERNGKLAATWMPLPVPRSDVAAGAPRRRRGDVLGGGEEHERGADADDRAELVGRPGERQQRQQGQHQRGLEHQQPGAVVATVPGAVAVEHRRPEELDRPDQADHLEQRQRVQRGAAVAEDRGQPDRDEADAEILRDVERGEDPEAAHQVARQYASAVSWCLPTPSVRRRCRVMLRVLAASQATQ